MSLLCRPLRKILNFETSPPPSNKPPSKNSFLQISPRGLVRGFTVQRISNQITDPMMVQFEVAVMTACEN